MTNQIETLGQELESFKNSQNIEKTRLLELMKKMKEKLKENFDLKKLLKNSENLRIDHENLNVLY